MARNELKTLSKENADWVAKHLVMASRLIEEDPELAHRHAMSAARRAGRIAVVRESLAITAYETGDYALALRELRTFRRISGSDEQLPLMVDSERGVGRPEKALELGRSVDRSTLTPASQVSLAIAMSGARLDLGSPELALGELEIPQLDPDRAFSYSAALYDAYAEVLTELGRDDEAAVWRRRATVAAELFGDGPDEDETIEIIEEEPELDDASDTFADGLAGDEGTDEESTSEYDDDALDVGHEASFGSDGAEDVGDVGGATDVDGSEAGADVENGHGDSVDVERSADAGEADVTASTGDVPENEDDSRGSELVADADDATDTDVVDADVVGTDAAVADGGARGVQAASTAAPDAGGHAESADVEDADGATDAIGTLVDADAAAPTGADDTDTGTAETGTAETEGDADGAVRTHED